VLRIRVLGSAAGGGFPQWNCNCAQCRSVRSGNPGVAARTQSSIAVSPDGRQWFLLNASPDLGQQLRVTPELRPPEGSARGSPIAGVVLTNADVDHVAGLLSLRERHPMTLHATRRVLAVLDSNPIFGVLDPGTVARCPLPLNEPVRLAGNGDGAAGLSVTAFPVPGKVALWMEAATGGDLRGGGEDTIGLEISDHPIRDAIAHDTGKRPMPTRVCYVPGCAAMTPALAERLNGADLLFFDGTTWSDDEMRTTGVGEKTAGRMGHMSMSGASGSLAALAGLNIARKVYIHINNTNPVLLPSSPERREAERLGWTIAEDGQEYILDRSVPR
jgi:pyrroloquinoline quinone biosynthesis protein B